MINPLVGTSNYSATSNNTVIGTLAVDGWDYWYREEERGRSPSPPRPLFAVPNVTAYPSTASVPITVLLYNGPLLCGLMFPLKGNLIYCQSLSGSYHLRSSSSMWQPIMPRRNQLDSS